MYMPVNVHVCTGILFYIGLSSECLRHSNTVRIYDVVIASQDQGCLLNIKQLTSLF
jgi:hypothetical protein